MMRAGKWKWKCDTYFVIKLSQNGNGLAVCMYINGLFFCPHPLLHYYYILVHCEQKVFPKPANFKYILIHLIQNWPDPLLPIKMKGLKYDQGFFFRMTAPAVIPAHDGDKSLKKPNQIITLSFCNGVKKSG